MQMDDIGIDFERCIDNAPFLREDHKSYILFEVGRRK